MPQVPAYANLSKTEDINYLCNVNSDLNFNCKFVRDRKVIVLRNCDISGNLIDLKTPAKYLDCKPWVLLSVREFEVYGLQTPVPIAMFAMILLILLPQNKHLKCWQNTFVITAVLQLISSGTL